MIQYIIAAGIGALTLETISAWSSVAAKRRCSRLGRSCFLESSWGV